MRSFAGMLAPMVAALTLAAGAIVASPTPVAAAINPANYTSRAASVRIADGASGGATANCPSGYKALTGGVSWFPTGLYNEDSLHLLRAYIRSSSTTADATGWYASGANESGQTLTFTVNVLCLPKGSVGTYTLKTREVTVDPGRSGNADLGCKSGQVAIGGGGAWHKPGAAPKFGNKGFLTASSPNLAVDTWLVAGRNEASVILMLRVRVLCVPKASVSACCGSASYLTSSNTSPVKTNAKCIQGKPLTGGYYWGYRDNGFVPPEPNTDSRAHVQSSSLVAGPGWYFAGVNTDRYANSDDPFFAIVICAGN